MICPYCKHANPEEANFCANCGRLLIDHCPRCRTAVSNPANFCQHCGLPLSPAGQGSWWAVDSGAVSSGAVGIEQWGSRTVPLIPKVEKSDGGQPDLDRLMGDAILAQKVQWNEDPQQAERLAAEAREVVQYIGDHAGPELRGSFLERPEVKGLMEPG